MTERTLTAGLDEAAAAAPAPAETAAPSSRKRPAEAMEPANSPFNAYTAGASMLMFTPGPAYSPMGMPPGEYPHEMEGMPPPFPMQPYGTAYGAMPPFQPQHGMYDQFANQFGPEVPSFAPMGEFPGVRFMENGFVPGFPQNQVLSMPHPDAHANALAANVFAPEFHQPVPVPSEKTPVPSEKTPAPSEKTPAPSEELHHPLEPVPGSSEELHHPSKNPSGSSEELHHPSEPVPGSFHPMAGHFLPNGLFVPSGQLYAIPMPLPAAAPQAAPRPAAAKKSAKRPAAREAPTREAPARTDAEFAAALAQLPARLALSLLPSDLLGRVISLQLLHLGKTNPKKLSDRMMELLSAVANKDDFGTPKDYRYMAFEQINRFVDDLEFQSHFIRAVIFRLKGWMTTDFKIKNTKGLVACLKYFQTAKIYRALSKAGMEKLFRRLVKHEDAAVAALARAVQAEIDRVEAVAKVAGDVASGEAVAKVAGGVASAEAVAKVAGGVASAEADGVASAEKVAKVAGGGAGTARGESKPVIKTSSIFNATAKPAVRPVARTALPITTVSTAKLVTAPVTAPTPVAAPTPAPAPSPPKPEPAPAAPAKKFSIFDYLNKNKATAATTAAAPQPEETIAADEPVVLTEYGKPSILRRQTSESDTRRRRAKARGVAWRFGADLTAVRVFESAADESEAYTASSDLNEGQAWHMAAARHDETEVEETYREWAAPMGISLPLYLTENLLYKRGGVAVVASAAREAQLQREYGIRETDQPVDSPREAPLERTRPDAEAAMIYA